MTSRPCSSPDRTPRVRVLAITCLLGASLAARAQVAPATTTPVPPADEERIILSPFEVGAKKDIGYLASSTLAGSRLNTSLYETPSAISVMTKDFLADVGATNVADALNYAVNAERDQSTGPGNDSANAGVPVAMRGFSDASLARNYFQWGLESDTYNTERIDFARGPNSILFGTGGPGGIVNTTTKRAVFGREIHQLGLRFGAWDERRATFDYSRPVGDKLALRVNGVLHQQESWRDFVSLKRHGVALALTYRPFKNTEIRFDSEYGEYDRILTNPYLPGDAVTPWIKAGRPLSAAFGTVVASTSRTTSRVYVHDPVAGTVRSWFGSVNTATVSTAQSAAIAGALTDFSVVPLKANVTGDGNLTDSRFTATGIFLEQKIGPLWFEAAANRQDSGRLWLSSANWVDAVVRADANAQLPNGQPNPNAGRLYVETNAQQSTTDSIADDFRATGAYTLDLTQRNPWLGSYTLTGLVSLRVGDQNNDNLFEVNTTPAGDATYPRDLTSANNRLSRRIYLDPFGSGAKGAVDARHNQFSLGGVTSGFRRVQNQGVRSREELRSRMFAGQAKLLKDRLVVTGGWRHDEQKNFAGTATQDPVTREFSRQILDTVSTDYSGDTTSFGGVFNLLPWAAVFYTKSDNFVPQSTLTIAGTQLGPRSGRGEDYGLKLRLLDNRYYVTLTRFQTTEVNRLIFSEAQFLNAINEIYEAIGDPTRVAGATARDGVDTEGRGYELELTANPTPQWRLTLNLSQTQGTQANNQPRNRAYVASHRAAWLAVASRPLVAPYQGVPAIDPKTGAAPTIATAIDSIDAFVTNMLAGNGVTRRQLREYTGSLFTAYTFKSDNRLIKDFTVGVGVRYRDKPVVGYINGLAPIYGTSDTLVNVLLRKPARLFGRRVQLQANLDNILNVNDPIVVDADVNGRYRFLYPTPFRWSLTATVDF